jgi:hypothetical protein
MTNPAQPYAHQQHYSCWRRYVLGCAWPKEGNAALSNTASSIRCRSVPMPSIVAALTATASALRHRISHSKPSQPTEPQKSHEEGSNERITRTKAGAAVAALPPAAACAAPPPPQPPPQVPPPAEPAPWPAPRGAARAASAPRTPCARSAGLAARAGGPSARQRGSPASHKQPLRLQL